MAENGRRPDFNVCVSKRSEDKTQKTRALQVGAAWAGEKGQLNVRLEVSSELVKAFLDDDYQFVFFPREPGQD